MSKVDDLLRDDVKWLAQIRNELFWKLDNARRNPSAANANARIVAFDKLLEVAGIYGQVADAALAARTPAKEEGR